MSSPVSVPQGADGSIYLGTVGNTVYSSIGSIIAGKAGIGKQEGGAYHSIVMGDAYVSQSGTTNNLLIKDSIILTESNFRASESISVHSPKIRGSLILNSQDQLDLGRADYNAQEYSGCIIVGPGHKISTTIGKYGVNVIGAYGTITNPASPAKLTVGCGSSTSARANCFETGKNSTDGCYITVGSTKLTEAQLQALLATL